MLTQGEDVEVYALARRGWPVSAIARQLDRDRKTVRGYLLGTRQPAVRASAAPDPLAPFAAYVGPVRRWPAYLGVCALSAPPAKNRDTTQLSGAQTAGT
jgi:hypothetical protein